MAPAFTRPVGAIFFCRQVHSFLMTAIDAMQQGILMSQII
jgi:hypothetical protein